MSDSHRLRSGKAGKEKLMMNAKLDEILSRLDKLSSMEPKIESIEGKLSKIEGDMKENMRKIKTELEDVKEKASMAVDQVETYSSELNDMKSQVEWLTTVCSHLQQENRDRKLEVLDIQARQMRSNLVFNGIAQTKKFESREECIEKLKTSLKENFHVTRTTRTSGV